MNVVIRRVNGVIVEHTVNGIAQPLDQEPAQRASVKTMARHAVKAVGAALRHGAATVSPEEQERRLAICRSCEFFIQPKKPGGNGRCAKCGCWLNLKSRLQAWHCPIDRW